MPCYFVIATLVLSLRVSIVTSDIGKHTLPVHQSLCAFNHNTGIELGQIEGINGQQKQACSFADGRNATNNEDLWLCMHEANCDITDDWLQMVIFRDPRPAVVSSYYYLLTHHFHPKGDLETFVAKELPILCQWLTVRYILFSGLLGHQSMEFWYDDSIADPLQWYYHWFDSVGVQLPFDVVDGVAKKAAANKLDYYGKKVDRHPGEVPKRHTGVRKFQDEVSPEMLKTADAVLRVWLPPVLLEKLGVSPE